MYAAPNTGLQIPSQATPEYLVSNTAQQIPPQPTPQVSPAQPTGAFGRQMPNIFGQVQRYQQQAGDIYGRLGQFQATPYEAVGVAGAPIQAGQLAGTDYGQYMSPYTQQVIQTGQADIERQRQLASENLAAQAQRANAFGGSRQAVQEGILAGEALRQAGALSAQQRQQAFQQAQQAAQYDIGQRYAADIANRQAEEAAAAREQATRADLYGGQFREAGIQSGGAQGLVGLGRQMFGQGQYGLQQQQRAAALAQQQQQAMLDAARQQTLANLGYPGQALQTGTGILGQLPSSSMTTAGRPGLFDILSGVSMIPGLPF